LDKKRPRDKPLDKFHGFLSDFFEIYKVYVTFGVTHVHNTLYRSLRYGTLSTKRFPTPIICNLIYLINFINSVKLLENFYCVAHAFHSEIILNVIKSLELLIKFSNITRTIY